MGDQEIAERLSFNVIDEETRDALREAKPFLLDALPAILDGFYAHIGDYPVLSAMFASQAVKDHAKQMQVRHWTLIAEGRFDESYVASVRRIGETHFRLGLDPCWYIGGYSFIITHVLRGISGHLRGSPLHPQHERRAAWLSAFTKAALLDMDFAISVYLDAGKRDKVETLERLAQAFDGSISGVIDEVVHSSRNLQENAEQLASIAKESKEKAMIVAAASTETSQTSASVASATEELSASIREISKQVQSSGSVAGEAAQMALAVSESMTALLEQTQHINKVSEYISGVAEQIDLLALNATIESARAGDAGKGFAIVASEVKNLAGQTATASEQIGRQVEEIQKASTTASERVQRIVDIIEAMNANSHSISVAVSEQSQATNEIARNVAETSSAANDVSRNIVTVEQGAEQTNSSSSQVLDYARTLSEQATLLRSKVTDFLQGLRKG